MAYDGKLTGQVREALSHLPGVEEKKMFGKLAFMVNGKMCINVGDNEIMIRIDPKLHEAAIEKQGCRPIEMKGRECKGFVYIREEGMKSKKLFDYWVGLALDFNKNAKASKKSRPLSSIFLH